MSWWLILLIIIVIIAAYNVITENLTRNKGKADNDLLTIVRQGKLMRQQQEEEYFTRLDNNNEQLAQRIKKLFYSASFHQTRNQVAFQNILSELRKIKNDILISGGQPKLNAIADRVVYLCGSDMIGFRNYMTILTN